MTAMSKGRGRRVFQQMPMILLLSVQWSVVVVLQSPQRPLVVTSRTIEC